VERGRRELFGPACASLFLEEEMKSKESYVQLECEFVALTEDAVLIKQGEENFWVPRSVLKYNSERLLGERKRGDEFYLSIAEWFANKIGAKY
jgi:hypothetical protein